MPFKLGAIWAAIKLDTAQFNQAIKVVQGQTSAAGTAATGAGTQFGGLWKKMAMGLGVAGGITLVTRTIIGQFSDMVQKGREFEGTWANVTTMMDATADEARDMRDELINLSPTLGDSTMLAEGLYQVLSASIPKDAAIPFLEQAAIAAKAGVTDVKTAVDALTTVINAYGLEASSANDLSDVMFQTVKRGKLTYEELAHSLGTVIPVAATTGVEFTEVSAAIASLTRQGIPAQTATMQLRQSLMAILKPAKGSADIMDELGISYGQNALKAHGLSGFLAELREKTQGNADTMAKIVPNVRALTGVMALAGSGAEGFATDMGLMEEALETGGQTTEAFDKQMMTFDATLETLKVAVDDFKISFWDGFVEGVESGIPTAKDFDDITKQLNEDFKFLGETIGVGVIGAVHNFTEKIRTAQKWMKLIDVTTKGFVLALKQKKIPTLKNAAKAYGDMIKEQEKSAAYSDMIKGLLLKGAEAMENLKEKVEDQTEATEEQTTAHKNLIPEIEATKNEFIDWLAAVASGKMTIDEYNQRLEGMSDEMIDLRKDLEDAPILEPEDLEPYFTELESAPSALASVLAGVRVQLEETHDSIAEHAKTLTEDTLPEFWENFAQDVGYIYGDLVWDLLDKTSTFEEAISGFFNNIVDMFKGMVASMVQEWMTNFVKNLVSGAADVGSSIASNIGSAVGGEGATSLAGGVSSLTSQITSLANPVTAIASAVGAIAGLAALASKPKGFSEHMWYLRETQENTQEMRDYMFIEQWKMIQYGIEQRHKIADFIWKVNEKTKDQIPILQSINKGIEELAKVMKKTTKAQSGYVSMSTELIELHGTPQKPEYVIPYDDLARMTSPAGGGGSRSTTNNITLVVQDQIDPYTAQRLARGIIIPQVLAALETNEYNRDFQYNLGIAL